MNVKKICLLVCLILGASAAFAQTTAFTYQGKLTDAGQPANNNYDLQFKLFDTATVGTGTQQGGTLVRNPVVVSAGVFTVTLDFGANVFSGADRYLEIGVRPAGSVNAYTLLAPRHPVSSTPYAIHTLAASTADSLSSACAGCVTSTQIGSLPANSGSYIQNTNSQQAASNFNISGTGTANILNAATQFRLAGNRILHTPGTNNLAIGLDAGTTVLGSQNVFVGNGAGTNNATGSDNAFLGTNAGFLNFGSANTFVGTSAGYNNQVDANSFFGRSAGFQNTTGTRNSFFGVQAGRDTQIGSDNAFFGYQAGIGNQQSYNSFFGSQAGLSNTTGSSNAFFGFSAGRANTTGSSNTFFGTNAGYFTTTGSSNTFFGNSAGQSNTTAFGNSFFGDGAGQSNTTGYANTFFGFRAGLSNTTAVGNSFFGSDAGLFNTTGNGNAFFGGGSLNTTGSANSFFGAGAGGFNTTGSANAFFGNKAGEQNKTGTNNTMIGGNADVGSDNLDHATAIGADVIVTASNRVQIGRAGIDTVAIGNLAPPTLSNAVCINGFGVLMTCASSQRYKENVQSWQQGLRLIQLLRPVRFDWKEGHQPDLGLIAEEVAEVEPLLNTYNQKGEIEGIKYQQLTVVLINAVKEQQAQIETQAQQVASLRAANAALQARLRAVEHALRQRAGAARLRH